MDGQLEAVRQDIGSVKNEIIKTKQDLAAAEQAGNKEKERVLWDLLLSLNNQLSGLNNRGLLVLPQAKLVSVLQVLLLRPRRHRSHPPPEMLAGQEWQGWMAQRMLLLLCLWVLPL